MHFNALIFDFDGTIADTLKEGARLYNLIAREEGFLEVPMDQIEALRALDTKHLLRHLQIPKRKVPMLLAKGIRLLRQSIPTLPLIEGMAEVLPQLARNAESFGILTSNSTENVEAFLRAHGIRDLFTFISSTSKLTGKAKHLRSIARTFSLTPAQMLYVGDEVRDVRAARKARIAAAAVTWGFNSREALAREEPRYLVDFPANLVDICGVPAP